MSTLVVGLTNQYSFCQAARDGEERQPAGTHSSSLLCKLLHANQYDCIYITDICFIPSTNVAYLSVLFWIIVVTIFYVDTNLAVLIRLQSYVNFSILWKYFLNFDIFYDKVIKYKL